MTLPTGAPVWPLEPWNAVNYYGVGSIVNDRGGVWQALVSNRNSRPISGNANWSLVGGAPYVRVTVTAAELLTAFSSPVTLIPGSPGLSIIGLWGQMAYTAGSRPFTLPGEPASPAIVFVYEGIPYDTYGLSFGGDKNDLLPLDFQDHRGLDTFGLNDPDFSESPDVRGLGVQLSTQDSNLPTTPGTPTVFTISDPGSGYAVGDTLVSSFDQPNGYRVTVSAVNGGGGVTAVTITASGRYPYWGVNDTDNPVGIAPQPGAGTGLELTVASIGLGNGTVTITLFYQLMA